MGKRKKRDEGGGKTDKTVSRGRGRREEDLACFSFGSGSGLWGLSSFREQLRFQQLQANEADSRSRTGDVAVQKTRYALVK